MLAANMFAVHSTVALRMAPPLAVTTSCSPAAAPVASRRTQLTAARASSRAAAPPWARAVPARELLRTRTVREAPRRPTTRARAVVIAAAGATSASATPAGPTLLWMRVGDLRTSDHPGLVELQALAAGGAKAAVVFVFDEEEIKDWAPSFARYVHTSVDELRSNLQALGAELIIRVGSAEKEVPALATQMGCAEVLTKEELEWARAFHLAQTTEALEAKGVALRTWVDAMRPWEGELLAFPTTTGAYYGPGKCKPSACLEWPEGTDLKSLKQDSLEAGAMPEVEQIAAFAKGEESDDEKKCIEAEKERERLMAPELVRMRARVDDTFVTAKNSVPVLQDDMYEEPPEVPFRLPGGEVAARAFFGSWMDFYVATQNPEFISMQQRILKDKNTAFFRVFRNAIAAGCLSTRQIYSDCRAYEIKSYRRTDLIDMATRVVEQRDFEAHLARRSSATGAAGPGWSLVGYYNLTQTV